uniref:SRCR domain-containing protein n=1 Tax=Amphimedon queenslandica TaxID=400682 RepID=A0A1X7SSB9_AMPQE
ATFLNETYFGAGNGSILLGSESTILQCNHSSVGSHNCGSNDTVGVQCAQSINNVSVCDTELSDQLWALMRANGNCEPYETGIKGYCDDFYDAGVTYVYIPKRRLGGSQTLLRQFLEEANAFLNQTSSHCSEIAKNVLLDTEYRSDEGVNLPLCNDTNQIINYLNLSSDCCSDGGVILLRSTVIAIMANTSTSATMSANHSITIQTTHTIHATTATEVTMVMANASTSATMSANHSITIQTTHTIHATTATEVTMVMANASTSATMSANHSITIQTTHTIHTTTATEVTISQSSVISTSDTPFVSIQF